MGFDKPPHGLAQVKVAPVQCDSKRPKRLDQSAFEVNGDDDVASAKDGSEVQCSCPRLDLLENEEITLVAFVGREGVEDREGRPVGTDRVECEELVVRRWCCSECPIDADPPHR